jgi:HlyD family secretion protein
MDSHPIAGGSLEMKAFFSRISKRNRIIIGVGIVVLVIVFLVVRGRGKSNSTSLYQTTPAQRGELTAMVGATGSVRAVQSAALNWQTTGTVEVVNAKVGDKVHKGDVLAKLGQASLPQSVLSAEVDFASAQQALDDMLNSDTARAQAAVTLQSAKDSYKKAYDYRMSLNGKIVIANVTFDYVNGQQIPKVKYTKGYADAATIAKADQSLALNKAQLDDAQRAYDRVKDGPNPTDVQAAKARVQAAQATLNMAFIIAPVDGTVTQASPLPGDQVSVGMPAFRIDDLSGLLVDVQVSEVDINNIAVDQPVSLTFDAISGKSYNGQVVEVSQAGDPSSGAVNFTVTAKITDGDSQVKPGMTAAVNIITFQVKDQLLVPNRAVRLVDGNQVVYILKNGQPQQVQIKLGASSDTMSVVGSGNLKEGDLVILNPPSQGGGPFRGGGGG